MLVLSDQQSKTQRNLIYHDVREGIEANLRSWNHQIWHFWLKNYLNNWARLTFWSGRSDSLWNQMFAALRPEESVFTFSQTNVDSEQKKISDSDRRENVTAGPSFSRWRKLWDWKDSKLILNQPLPPTQGLNLGSAANFSLINSVTITDLWLVGLHVTSVQ